MKKNKRFTKLLAIIAIATIPMACTNEDALEQQPQNPSGKATIRATMPTPADTRMSVTDTGTFGAEKLELKWEVGDEIFVCKAGSTTAQATYEIATTNDIEDDGKTATFTPVGDVSEVNITNGVAYFADKGGSAIIVPTSQSANDNEPFAGKKLPMKAEGITITNGACPDDIVFKHMAYVLKFSFKLNKPSTAVNPQKITLSAGSTCFSQSVGSDKANCEFTLTDYSFAAESTNTFYAYIPLLPVTGKPLGSIQVRLEEDVVFAGIFNKATTSTTTPFTAGLMYSAGIEFDALGTGTIIESSEFNNEVAGRDATYLAGISYGGDDGSSATKAIEIGSADQLKKLIAEVKGGNNYKSKHFKLTKDIHVTADVWTSLGTYSKPFWGNFDGNGHVITGALNLTLSENKGFFGEISENTTPITIKNLTIAANVTRPFSSVGGIVGTISPSRNGTVMIRDCHFNGNISGKVHAGGIVGDIRGNTDTYAQVFLCTSRGSVTTSGTETYDGAGGIVGIAYKDALIGQCTNYAKVIGNNATKGRVGGIAGATSINISKCKNYGEICGNESLGGIVGYSETSGILSISENENYGKVGTPTATNVGGIMGWYAWGNNPYTYTKNTNSSSNIAGSSYVGAICGNYGEATEIGNTTNTNSAVGLPDVGSAGTAYP